MADPLHGKIRLLSPSRLAFKRGGNLYRLRNIDVEECSAFFVIHN